MKYIDNPTGCFIDRAINEPEIEKIDVIMPTLDEENFIEKCLFTIYREIPVRKLIVCDGGSKDDTIKKLENFPRLELHVRPDIHTFGKVMEFLFSQVKTEWFAIMDAHLELPHGWYDEMKKHTTKYDVLENNRRLKAYHFCVEDLDRLDPYRRPTEWCHLLKHSVTKNYKCDDDYMWRETDIFFRQIVENSGYKYGKIDTITHIHNETEKTMYESDDKKNFQKIIFKPPEFIITDEKKYESFRIENAKGVAKYLDPENSIVKYERYHDVIQILDKEWLEKNAPKWLKYYNPKFDTPSNSNKKNS
jgi:glycosyltransferase involved in cell wall biosynthesis